MSEGDNDDPNSCHGHAVFTKCLYTLPHFNLPIASIPASSFHSRDKQNKAQLRDLFKTTGLTVSGVRIQTQDSVSQACLTYKKMPPPSHHL